MHAYEARQREYGMKGHRHFYFMTLNGSEVRGNLFTTCIKLVNVSVSLNKSAALGQISSYSGFLIFCFLTC